MSISSSALLVELNISVWPASKLDREITDKVNSDASAVRGASQTKKNLFAGTSTTQQTSQKFAARVRLYNNQAHTALG
jgi:predicted transcriptional regulator with HTH domain